MAETLKIEIYRKKDAEDFTRSLADPASRLDTGGAAAACAALAASLLSRAAALTAEEGVSGERLDYMLRNAEILRGYMVRLIDEDVKCRGPLRRAIKEGDPQKIEAGRETAAAICAEIVGMMLKDLELALELAGLAVSDAKHYLRESGLLALGAVRTAMSYILHMSAFSTDETYRFVTRRENEITLSQAEELFAALEKELENA